MVMKWGNTWLLIFFLLQAYLAHGSNNKKPDIYARFKEELGILKYCDIDYSLPLEGAGEWQKPQVPLLLIPGVYF